MPKKEKQKKTSKRLNAYGVDPEDLLKAALNTPPPEKEEETPDKKKQDDEE